MRFRKLPPTMMAALFACLVAPPGADAAGPEEEARGGAGAIHSSAAGAGAASEIPVIPLEEVAAHVGKRVTVVDTVKAVSSSPRSGTVYVNFGDAYPRQKLSLRIAKEHEDLGKGAYGTLGLKLRATGIVESGKDGPAIEITSADQVEIVKDDSIDLIAAGRPQNSLIQMLARKAQGLLASLMAIITGRPAPPPGPYDTLPRDGEAFGALLRWKLEKLFREGRYEELEEVAAAWRRPEARMLDGRWHLSVFYNVLGISSRSSEETFAEMRRKLGEWRTRRPDAIEPVILLASLECSYAWNARGNGWAHTVTEEGWRLMRERLVKAKALLESVHERRFECPEWANVMQRVALGQNWPDEQVKNLLGEATAAWPEYWSYYFSEAHRLLPRWGGAPGEWEEYSRSFEGDLGKELSARIPWAQSWAYTNLFKETDIPWSQMRDGFEFLVKRYPESARTKSAYARYAVIAEDRETCKRLLDELGENVSMEFWVSWQNVDIVREWIADTNRPAPWFFTRSEKDAK